MTSRIRTSVSCLFFAILLITGCSSSNGTTTDGPPVNNVPPYIEQQAQQLISDLTSSGFEVKRGYFKLYTANDCTYSYSQMKTCFGNNPAAPYIMFAVPSWPEEFVDPATNIAFGQSYPGYNGSFRFDPKEAVIVFGLMPPPGAYFGMQTYLFTREGTFDTNSTTYKYIATYFPGILSTFFSLVPQNSKRIQPNSSISNNNNNIVIQQQSGSSFDQERFFIITPDKMMDSTIRLALNRISVTSQNIFTEPIPSQPGNLSNVRTGLSEQADELAWLMRYAMPYDSGEPGTPSYIWKKDLPLVVLRVRDAKSNRLPEPYGAVVLETRTAKDESWLQNDLAGLVAAVNKKWGKPCSKADCSDQETSNFADLQPPPINLVGPLCLQVGMNCLADTQDTSYMVTTNQTIDNGEIYAVVGILGTETGNATYVGLSVNDSLMVKGIANISGNQLKNTAAGYSGIVNNTDKMYVYYFTRNCSGLDALTGGNCFSVTEDMIPRCTTPGQTCDYMKLIQREYITQGTRRGPDSTKLLLPKLLVLKRQ